MQFIQGVPEKMALSEKGAYLTKGNFFWGTWYMVKVKTINFVCHSANLNLIR